MKFAGWIALAAVAFALSLGCASNTYSTATPEDVAVFTKMPEGAVSITDIAASGTAPAKDGSVPESILLLLKRQASALGGDAVVINGSLVIGSAITKEDAGGVSHTYPADAMFQVFGATVIRVPDAR